MTARAPSLVTLARRSWIVAVAMIVSVGIALGLTARQEPRYTARATWVVVPVRDIDDPADLLRSLETLERRTVVATFARLPSTSSVREDLAARLEADPDELRPYALRGSLIPYTNMIRFEVEGPDATFAARAANGLARQIRNEALSLYHIYTLREVEPAYASRTPTHPDASRNAVVGALIGLFVGLGAAAAPLMAPSRPHGERSARSDSDAA